MKMPFVYKNSYGAERQKIPQEKISAPSRRSHVNWCKKRAFSSALSVSLRGSLTIEAALILPIFILFIVAILSFLIIINLQTSIQLKLEEAARSLGKTAYALNAAGEAGENALSEIGDGSDTDISSILTSGINSLTIRASVLDGNLSEKINSSRIEGGAGGINMAHSSYDDDGCLKIVASYNYSLPFLPSSIAEFSFSQECNSRAWIGKSLTESGNLSASDADSQTVYVTPNGTVYHTSESCNYLDLSIRSVDYSTVDSLRNKSGAKYERCSCCSGSCSTVYITDYGTNYHSSLSCSGLKRTVIEVDISEVGDMKVCSKCGGTH